MCIELFPPLVVDRNLHRLALILDAALNCCGLARVFVCENIEILLFAFVPWVSSPRSLLHIDLALSLTCCVYNHFCSFLNHTFRIGRCVVVECLEPCSAKAQKTVGRLVQRRPHIRTGDGCRSRPRRPAANDERAARKPDARSARRLERRGHV